MQDPVNSVEAAGNLYAGLSDWLVWPRLKIALDSSSGVVPRISAACCADAGLAKWYLLFAPAKTNIQ